MKYDGWTYSSIISYTCSSENISKYLYKSIGSKVDNIGKPVKFLFVFTGIKLPRVGFARRRSAVTGKFTPTYAICNI